MAMQDCGALVPEKIDEEQDYEGQEDARGVEEFLAWAMGQGNKEIRRIALEGGDGAKEDYLTGLIFDEKLQQLKLIVLQSLKRNTLPQTKIRDITEQSWESLPSLALSKSRVEKLPVSRSGQQDLSRVQNLQQPVHHEGHHQL